MARIDNGDEISWYIAVSHKASILKIWQHHWKFPELSLSAILQVHNYLSIHICMQLQISKRSIQRIFDLDIN